MWRSSHGVLSFINKRFPIPVSRRISRLNSLGSSLRLHRVSIPPHRIGQHHHYHHHTASLSERTLRDPDDLTLSDAQRRTIYALSTPPGKAGVGVIRISGPDVPEVWKRMVRPARRTDTDLPEPLKMERCQFIHPETGEVLDDGLAVYFKGPKSFTTEDVLEFHIHSGRAIISSILASLSRLLFCRPAEPGEFTRRAFNGGRLDLTQVEGLKDLVDAETDGQRRMALRAAGGASRAQFEQLRNDIISCLATVEALIDFGEGEDIEEGVYEQAKSRARKLEDTIQSYLSDHRRGEIIRSGIRLAIFGPPNAGKSSLLNFLAQREAAIVTPVPGTTRDILELSLDIGGLPVIVADTAGLRKTEDVVERIGVERAKNAVEASDVSLCVLSLPSVIEMTTNTTNTSDASTPPYQITLPPSLDPLITPNTIFLFNKSDLLSDPLMVPPTVVIGSSTSSTTPKAKGWVVSLSTGEGTSDFMSGLASTLHHRYGLQDTPQTSTQPIITHARHRVHLESALRFLQAFSRLPVEEAVFGAEELRYAAQAVGKVSGSIDVEDVLDAVFRDFCIGK